MNGYGFLFNHMTFIFILVLVTSHLNNPTLIIDTLSLVNLKYKNVGKKWFCYS